MRELINFTRHDLKRRMQDETFRMSLLEIEQHPDGDYPRNERRMLRSDAGTP